MKKYFFILCFYLCFYQLNAQVVNADDYQILNEVMNNLIGDKRYLFLKKDNDTTIAMYESILIFEKQKEFFTKDYIARYIGGVPLGKNGIKKVKKLIRTIDFDYLANQKRDATNWDLAKFTYPFKKYITSNNSSSYKTVRLSIALPVYSKDKKTVFIFYSHPCHYDGCGATTVKVYKKIKEKWVWYVNFPITLA
jgi:hypothetical protein